MMSLRTIARAAPLRASSRIITSSSLIRPAFQQATRRSVLPAISRAVTASFSTTRSRFDQQSQHLAAKLEQEIGLEAQSAADGTISEQSVKQFFDEVADWKVIDTEGEQDVFLQKTYEGEEVTVHFSIADFNVVQGEEAMEDDLLTDEDDLEGQSGGASTKGSSIQGRTSGGNFRVAPEDNASAAEQEDVLDEDDQGAVFPVNVTVLIRRPDNSSKGSLRFDLVAENGEFEVQQLTHLPQSSASAAEQIREAYDGRSNQYTGPPFHQLDDDVQQYVEEYLNARGITSQLALFIPDYVDVKEQKEYQAWLNRVKGFLEE